MAQPKGIACLLLICYFIYGLAAEAEDTFTKIEEKRFLAEVAEKAGRYRDMEKYADQVIL